jgi:Flp pilus assembly secretin CpaC
VAKAKELIDLSLDEDNVQLANKILLGPRNRKAVPAMLASSVEIASGGDSFAAGGMVRTSLQPTLFECTPPHSFALSGRFYAEHEE